jgi:hypothetical protein
MSTVCKLGDERACALNGKYTIHIQSNDGETMFAGLHALMEQLDFNAHLHHDGDYWCAMVATDSLELVEALSERLAGVWATHHHWVRMMLWDEARQLIVFDRTYSPEGDMQEPIPG